MKDTNRFIDIHAHILPGVDDGSGSMDETVRMLQIAQEQQIEIIIATPHYAAGAKNSPVEQLKQVREQVQAEAYKINQDMRILLGNEIYYSGSVLDALKAQEALTLADSRYVLVEFSTRESYDVIFKGLGEIINSGYIPVVAHIERYRCFYKHEYLISDLIKSGCYIQMNCDSIIGGIFNSEAVYHRKLINQGLVHLVGSDCHDDKQRIPCMMSAWSTLQKKCDEGLVSQIFSRNPFKVLENTYI